MGMSMVAHPMKKPPAEARGEGGSLFILRFEDGVNRLTSLHLSLRDVGGSSREDHDHRQKPSGSNETEQDVAASEQVPGFHVLDKQKASESL